MNKRVKQLRDEETSQCATGGHGKLRATNDLCARGDSFFAYRAKCYKRLEFRNMTVAQVLDALDGAHCGD